MEGSISEEIRKKVQVSDEMCKLCGILEFWDLMGQPTCATCPNMELEDGEQIIP